MASTAVMRSRAQACFMLWPGTTGCDRAKKPREGTGSFPCWWQGQTINVRIDHCGAWSDSSLLVPAAMTKLSPTAPRSLQQPHCQFDRHSSDPCETHVPVLLPLENEGEAGAVGGGGTLTLSTEHGKAARPQHLPRAGHWDPAHPQTQIHCRMLSSGKEKEVQGP